MRHLAPHWSVSAFTQSVSQRHVARGALHELHLAPKADHLTIGMPKRSLHFIRTQAPDDGKAVLTLAQLYGRKAQHTDRVDVDSENEVSKADEQWQYDQLHHCHQRGGRLYHLGQQP